MTKALNALCLALWIVQLIYAIGCAVNNMTISPMVYMCPVLVCILRYSERLFEEG